MKNVESILAEVLNLSESEISETSSISNISSWDSLSHMQIIADIESNYSIQLTGDDIVQMIDLKSIKLVLSKYL